MTGDRQAVLRMAKKYMRKTAKSRKLRGTGENSVKQYQPSNFCYSCQTTDKRSAENASWSQQEAMGENLAQNS